MAATAPNEIRTKVLIIGSGPAGYTAAIYAARASLKPVLVQGMAPGGQMTITTDVENYPGFADVIQGPWLMEQMQAQAAHCGAEIVSDLIASVDFSAAPYRCVADSGDVCLADAVILATGAQARWLGLASEQKFSGFGVSACATCDGFFFRGKEVAVVGGGNTAVEEANYLANLASKVTLIHRRDELRAEKVLQDRLLANPKIEVLWNHVVEEVLGAEEPLGVTGLRLRNVTSGRERHLAVDGVFIAIGHDPATALVKGQLDMDEHGYVLTRPDSTATNLPGVFAAGDVQDRIYRQAVTAAGTGCMAALEAEKYLAELEAAAPAAPPLHAPPAAECLGDALAGLGPHSRLSRRRRSRQLHPRHRSAQSQPVGDQPADQRARGGHRHALVPSPCTRSGADRAGRAAAGKREDDREQDRDHVEPAEREQGSTLRPPARDRQSGLRVVLAHQPSARVSRPLSRDHHQSPGAGRRARPQHARGGCGDPPDPAEQAGPDPEEAAHRPHPSLRLAGLSADGAAARDCRRSRPPSPDRLRHRHRHRAAAGAEPQLGAGGGAGRGRSATATRTGSLHQQCLRHAARGAEGGRCGFPARLSRFDLGSVDPGSTSARRPGLRCLLRLPRRNARIRQSRGLSRLPGEKDGRAAGLVNQLLRQQHRTPITHSSHATTGWYLNHNRDIYCNAA
ncbi:MAG: thioredoxin-disulfide reductase [Rhizobiales bacterium]|nr:thioredoxin-disulfide reductase [Hyphomicrobiales bacterium]